MKRIFPLLFLSFAMHGQKMQEKLIVTDKDSSLLKGEAAFGKNGDYCFVTGGNGKNYFVSNKKIWGPYKDMRNMGSSAGSIRYSGSYFDKEEEWYYKNAYGTAVFGPVKGELKRVMTNTTSDSIAITLLYHDSMYCYMNGRFVCAMSKDKSSGFEVSSWCVFSPKGNSLYYKKRSDGFLLLYKNNKLVDSATSFSGLMINDRGECIYGKGMKPTTKGAYDFMYFTHVSDTVFGPVRTVWDYDLKENGGYYYSGDDNGPEYILIDHKLYKDIHNVDDVTIIDKNHFSFTYKKDKKTFMNVNGKSYEFPYDEILYPTVGSNGDFSFYEIENYYLYRVVNGRRMDSISNFGVRGEPLYISPSGSSLHLFVTDDSTYIFRDKQKLFPAFPSSKQVEVSDGTKKLPSPWKDNRTAATGNNLLYLLIDSTGYFVYNGNFSKPLLPVLENSWRSEKKVGEIVAGRSDEYGFFMIQKTGKDSYLIDVNNKVYEELHGVQEIFENSCFFDAKQLIFYGTKGKSFYQYTIAL